VAAALAVVPGVVSSSMASGPDGTPLAVRIVLGADADEVEVAATAHRILRLQFGLGLDPAHIQLVDAPATASAAEEELTGFPTPRLRLVDDDSPHVLEIGGEIGPILAQVDAEVGRYGTDVLESAVRHPAGAGTVAAVEEPVDDPAQDEPRLVIAHLSVLPDGLTTSSVVTLHRGGKAFVGTAESATSADAVQHGIAQATTQAVVAALGVDQLLEVETTAVVPVGSLEVVVVQVGWTVGGTYERLLGAAEVRDDVRRTVIRATLDAVNRRLALALDR
jgi:hypothetical protein